MPSGLLQVMQMTFETMKIPMLQRMINIPFLQVNVK